MLGIGSVGVGSAGIGSADDLVLRVFAISVMVSA